MPSRSSFFLSLVIAVSVTLLSWGGMLSWLTDPIGMWVVIPIKRSILLSSQALWHAGGIVQSYQMVGTLKDDLRVLKQTNEELQHSVRALREENDQMRKQLSSGLHARRIFPAIVAGISTSMEIAAGSSDGIRPGMSVVSQESLVGKVVEVSLSRSKVMLLTDPTLSIPVRTSRGVEGVLSGKLGGTVWVHNILQKDPIFLDDQVFTTGAGGFPPNILIGSFSYISSSDVAVYKEAKVAPNADYTNMKIVFIIVSE